MRIRRIRNYFCIMLLAILWLSACAKPDQEPYSVDECPLPNSDNIGDTDFFSMDIMPKGMISLLPDSFKQLAFCRWPASYRGEVTQWKYCVELYGRGRTSYVYLII